VTLTAKFQLNELNNLLADKKSCVKRRLGCNRKLYLKPCQLTNLKESIKDCLDSEVTTYDEDLDGIILSFKNVKVCTTAEDIPGIPEIPVNYSADVYVFKPKVGSILTGIANKKSEGHIGCLIHKLFNVTIPRPKEVLTDEWDGNSVNIGDQVTFRIDSVDLTGHLPYIRGSISQS